MDKNASLISKIASNAIIAALYVVLTLVSWPIAYGDIQIRIAEAMIFLCFFRRDFVIGITLGCLLSNLSSSLGPWDILFGTSATLIASLLVAYASPKLLIAAIYPILINAFVIGGELYFILEAPFWLSCLFVALGETAAIALGYFFFMLAKRKFTGFFSIIHANRHLDFSW